MNLRYKFKSSQPVRKETPCEVRKILLHPIISYIYSTYGLNPTPRKPHRRDISASILQRLPSHVHVRRYQDFKTSFCDSMNMSFVQIKKSLETSETRLRTNCGKVLVNSLFFRCLDCEVQNESALATVYCPDCFSTSKHEGHRVISKISENIPINCDCGDPNTLKEQGFCPNHGLANEEGIREAIRAFPENLRENFSAVMANVFYALFNLCEEYMKRPIEERKEDSRSSLDQLMEHIIAIVKELYKINLDFRLVISRFLMKTLQEFPQGNLLHHDCYNFKRNELNISRSICHCTYLTNILRFHSLFSKELNSYLTGFFADLMIDPKFRTFFSDSLTRYIRYLFPIDEAGDFDCYGLENMATQAYSGELNCKVILSENIDNIIDLFEDMMERIPLRFEDLKDKHITALSGIMNFIYLLPEKNWAGKILIEDTNVIERFLQAVVSLQEKHLQYIIEYSPPYVLDGWNYNVPAFSRELELSAQILRTVNMIFNSMSVKGLQMKRNILDTYKLSMLRFLQDKEDLRNEMQKCIEYVGDTSITLHQMLQRVFVYLVGHHLSVNNHSISLIHITSFIHSIFGQSERGIARISTKMVEEGLKCIGALNYLILASTADNFSVSYHYYLPSSPFYYYDMLAIQIFAAFIPSKKIFKTFWKYFFVLDDSTTLVFKYFFENAWSVVDVNDIRRIRTFLQFLAHFLTTELPIVNAFSGLSKVKANKFKQSINVIHAKSLALMLQKFSNQYIDIQTVKNCADLVMSDQLDHAERLEEICDVEKKTGKIKLKSEYKSIRQTYYFADMRIEKELAQSFSENFPDKDIIDSHNFNMDFDVLTIVREKFYEGELTSWLARFFIGFREDWIDFLPHVMKLVLIGLELVRNKTSNKICEMNIRHEIIQNKEFMGKLEEIEKSLADKGAGSLTLTFKRIRETITQCSNVEQENKGKEESGQSNGDEEAERKRKIRQRQLEIQKQFQMKQANFVQNMKPENQKAFVEEKKKEEETKKEAHVCHFCREAIDLDGSDYGVPIYVGKCNINFSEKEVKSQDNLLESVYEATNQASHASEVNKNPKERIGRSKSCLSSSKKGGVGKNNDTMKIKYYPFITSCMHMAHVKCHDNYIKDIDDEEAYFFCAYCKSTYNILLTKCAAKTIRDARKATVKLNDTQRIPLPFTRTFVKAVGVTPSQSGSITIKELSYLIHLLLAGFLQVTKNKCLYDLESFMAKRYLPYKLLFENMTRFMKDYSKCFKVDLGDTIFSLFYKSIYEAEEKVDVPVGPGVGFSMNTPPSKNSKASKVVTSTLTPSQGLSSIKKSKPVDVSGVKSPIRPRVYPDKCFSSNLILHQLQSNRIKAIYTKTKSLNTLSKVIRKTIPEKKVEVLTEKETTPKFCSLQSLEPSDAEVNTIKNQLSCLVKEELEEALQKEIIKAMRTKLQDGELKRILHYGVFLGTLQVLIKVLCKFDEDIDIGSYQEITEQVMGSEFLCMSFKEELITFLERMLTISFMAFNIKEAYVLGDKIQEIVSSSGDDEKYINALLGTFDPKLNLKCLLSENILTKLKIEEGFIKAWLKILSETLASDTAKEKAQSLNCLSNPHLVIDLPESYLEFTTKYVSKKCDLCKGLSLTNHSAICLQCGATFCLSLSPCSSKNSWGDNLCDHANSEHKGECIGLCIQTCEIILVCSKFKTFLKESLYVDKFGQCPMEIDIEMSHVDWNTITLRKPLMAQITGWISNHKIVQQIGYEIQKYHMAS